MVAVPAQEPAPEFPKAEVKGLSFYYGDFHALKSLDMPV
jgi:hypothetical protein